MKPNRDIWAEFHEAFRHADNAFRSVDWRAMDDVRHTKTDDMTDPLNRRVHTLTASTWKSRRRMAGLFLWLAWRILTCGRATVKL